MTTSKEHRSTLWPSACAIESCENDNRPHGFCHYHSATAAEIGQMRAALLTVRADLAQATRELAEAKREVATFWGEPDAAA